MPDDDALTVVSTPTSLVEVEAARNNLIALGKRADEAAYEAVPSNTRRAYELELHCYASWRLRHGERPPAPGERSPPADPDLVRRYLHELADKGRHPQDLPKGHPRGAFGYSALMRTLSAICRSNVESGYGSIWKHPLIIKTRQALAVMKTEAPRKPKRGIGAYGPSAEEALLFRICDLLDDSTRCIRDRALILVGWHGGRRRSEIAVACVEHFRLTTAGFQWTIPRSKTDQTGKGHTFLLPYGQDARYCPVRALQRWLEVAGIESGPVFRGVDLSGAVMAAHLAPEGVSRRVQVYAEKLGLDPRDFGGHSLRRGFITTAHRAGRSAVDIMKVTGHRDIRTLTKYIEQADSEDRSAAKGLLDEALAKAPRPAPAPSSESIPEAPATPVASPHEAPGAPATLSPEIQDPEGLLALIPNDPDQARQKRGRR